MKRLVRMQCICKKCKSEWRFSPMDRFWVTDLPLKDGGMVNHEGLIDGEPCNCIEFDTMIEVTDV